MKACGGTFEVFYAVGLLPYARRRHTRNDAHCYSYAHEVLRSQSQKFWKG